MTYLQKVIRERSRMMFPVTMPPGISLVDVAYDTWYYAANELRKECQAQGLHLTVQEIDAEVAHQVELSSRRHWREWE